MRTVIHSCSLLPRDAVVYECAACGAAVSDIDTHREWHREVEAVVYATPPPFRPDHTLIGWMEGEPFRQRLLRWLAK